MFYWPITTLSGDFCAQNGTTVTPSPTAPDGSPNTAIYNGLTLTSPSAYLVVSAVNAQLKYRACNRRTSWTIMPDATPATVAVHPSDVSSVFNPGLNRVGARYDSYSFDWADMNTVRWEAYSSAECWKNANRNCERVWHAYTPRVGLPRAVTGVREEWKFCDVWGSVDPVMVPVTAGVSTTFSAVEARVTDGGEGVVEEEGEEEVEVEM
jgi:hypothetical protein